MSKSTKLSLTKHVQKKKGSPAASKILPGQRLMSSYFSVATKQNPPVQKVVQKDQENDDDIQIIDVKKENVTIKSKPDSKSGKSKLSVSQNAKKLNDVVMDTSESHSDKTHSDNSHVLRELSQSLNDIKMDTSESHSDYSDKTHSNNSHVLRELSLSQKLKDVKMDTKNSTSDKSQSDKSQSDKSHISKKLNDDFMDTKESDKSEKLSDISACHTSENLTDVTMDKNSQELKEHEPMCHPTKKFNDGLGDTAGIIMITKSPFKPKESSDVKSKEKVEKVKQRLSLDDSTADIFSEEDKEDSPGGTKRKRNLSCFSENVDDDLDFLAQLSDLEFSITQETKYEDLSLSEIHRCEVISVQYQAGTQLLELASFANKNQRAKCTLLHTWAYECELIAGMIISVRATWNTNMSCWEIRDDDEQTMLVENPDLMLGCTSIMSGLRCRRAAVFGEKFKGLGFGDEKGYMLLGQLLHELTQQCLQTGTYMPEDIIEMYSALLSRPRVARTLYSQGHKRSDLEIWAEPYYSSISKFMRRHASPQGIPPELVSESKQVKGYSDVWPGTITKVVDIEDTIWLPQLGLKGKLDVTCKVKVYPHMVTKELPVELKTGQNSDNVAHRGQLMFYTAMLEEVEKRRVDTGLLVYLKDCLVREVKPVHGEKRDAIIMRNEIARHLCSKPSVCDVDGVSRLKHAVLPPPITRAKECTFCPYVDVCASYISQEGLADSLSEKMPQRERLQSPDFTQAHRDYFIHWTCLVQLEEQVDNPMTKMWTSTPQQRESNKEGCIAGLQVTEQITEEDRFITTLMREGENGDSLISSGINTGDLVAVGNAKRLVIELASVVKISETSIILTVVKDITARFGKAGFNLDLYRSVSSMSNKLSALGNLIANTPEAVKLRAIIIDKLPAIYAPNLDYEIAAKLLPQVIESLNEDQEKAIKKVLEARDFTLIRGLPGTGKTSTIVSLVRILVALNRSVVITSHTNSAVDNVLVRLLKHGVPLLRLGSSNRAVPALLPHCEEQVLGTLRRTEEIDTVYKTRIVVGVTCASSGHMLLKKRKFDVCIVDEATQVQQPAVLGTLLSARTFVLVGDPDQLQPVVTNPTASALGMKETLFERLATPENTMVLGCQYRMNSTICHLVNHLTYNGALKCGSNIVAKASFSLPKSVNDSEAWMVEVLSLLPIHSVVFLDTGCQPDATPSFIKDDEGENKREAAVMIKILKTFKQGGVDMAEVGVMSPFRGQANLLRALTLQEHGTQLEVSTIDQFQGKDKHVALLSCVRSFPETQAPPKERNGILNDFKRLTVALSRARVKVVIVGDAASLKCYAPFCKLFSGLSDEQMVTLTEGERGFSWSNLTQQLKDFNM